MAHLIGKKAFGDRLRRERRLKAVEEDRDIEQQEIAEKIGVDPATVGRWLRSETMPRDDDTFAKLARYFGVTIGWLHYGQEPRVPEPEVAAKDRSGHRAKTTEAGGTAKRGTGT